MRKLMFLENELEERDGRALKPGDTVTSKDAHKVSMLGYGTLSSFDSHSGTWDVSWERGEITSEDPSGLKKVSSSQKPDYPSSLRRESSGRFLDERGAGERPPKAWMDDCMKNVKGGDKGAICGNIWHNVMGPSSRKTAKKRGTLKAEDILGPLSGLLTEDGDIKEALTKQHFERIAEILRPHAASPVARAIAVSLAEYFKSENLNFGAERFIRAAGMAHQERELPLAASADEEHDEPNDEDEPKRKRRLAHLEAPWNDSPELGGHGA